MRRDQYWDQWFAEQDRRMADITAEFDRIMAEGYEALGEPRPERTAGHRANRDRKSENEEGTE
jgi:hypothetical protein